MNGRNVEFVKTKCVEIALIKHVRSRWEKAIQSHQEKLMDKITMRE